MPFRSKAQMRAAFGGYLGPEMQAKAKEFADATPNPKALPMHVKQPMHVKKHALMKALGGGT